MRKVKQPQPYRVYVQYVLIGAAIGLYYGLFYNNAVRTPDYGIAVLLILVAAVVTVIVRSWKKKRNFREILIDFLKVLFFFLIFMLGLEARTFIAGLGGKVAVIVFTTTLGTLMGFLAALRKKA